MSITSFLKSDSGAVAVDWVVLTAGSVGLGLATMTVVSGGVENLSMSTSSGISGVGISDRFFEAAQILAMDFASGAGNFVGGTATNMGGALGDLLMIGPNETAEVTLDIPDGAESAVLTFDLIGGDSLDAHDATIMINGQPVTVATGTFGGMSFNNTGIPGVTVETQTVASHTELGGMAHDVNWTESVTTVTMTVENPGDSLTFGVHSAADQPVNDEFFAVDNLAVGVE